MGPLGNTPYLKRRHSLEDEYFIPNKIPRTNQIDRFSRTTKTLLDATNTIESVHERCVDFTKQNKLKRKYCNVINNLEAVHSNVNCEETICLPKIAKIKLRDKNNSNTSIRDINNIIYCNKSAESVTSGSSPVCNKGQYFNKMSNSRPSGLSVGFKTEETSNCRKQAENPEYNGFNYWKSPVDEVTINDLVSIFSPTKEETHTAASDEEMDDHEEDSKEENPSYNSFNYWKMPIPSLEELNLI